MPYVLEFEDAILAAPQTVFTKVKGRFSKRGPLDFDFRVTIEGSARDHSRHVLVASLVDRNSVTDGCSEQRFWPVGRWQREKRWLAVAWVQVVGVTNVVSGRLEQLCKGSV